MIPALALSSLIALAQAPGAGWVMAPAPSREVRRVYWELFETTEVWVRLTPGDPNGTAPLLSLVFQAFFPGRVQREAYSLLPQWPRGAPARLVVRVEPFLLTAVRDLTLRLELDGYTFNLTGPGSRYAILSCGDDCTPNAIEVDLEPSLLRALIAARTIRGEALGFPIQLMPADQRALGDFAARVGLSATRK
jgi:hypothetical protein